MGNSNASSLKAAIINNNLEEVRHLLEKSPQDINELINKKGDSPLMLAALLGRTSLVSLFLDSGADIHHVNKDGNTALDLAIQSSLPADGDILYKYRLESEYSSDSSDGATTPPSPTGPQQSPQLLKELPDVVRVLLNAGGRGKTLERLVLYAMKEKDLVRYIIEVLDDLADPKCFRISGLLLQVAVWFDQAENLRLLLDKGVNMQNFWSASFMPRIEPSHQQNLIPMWTDDEREADEYCIMNDTSNSDPLQELKFCFVHEWWADWNDGANPCAQYRAGLQVTPESALFFIKSANTPAILDHVMEDIMQYLPPTCAGPDLRTSCLFNCLTMAGYVFHTDQEQHLRLKFNVELEPHRNFNKQPKKLRYLCRISIRFMFKTNVQLALMNLPELPMQLKDFLLLENDICI